MTENVVTNEVDATEEVEEVVPQLVLDESPEGTFTAVTKVPRWAVLKASAAAKKKDKEGANAAFLDLAMNLVVETERARFDEYMMEHDEALDTLHEKIGDLLEVLANRPLVK